VRFVPAEAGAVSKRQRISKTTQPKSFRFI